jgi:hypothetical protein
MTTAKKLRDAGLQQVEENANKEWTELVIDIIETLARTSSQVDSDKVWVELQKFPQIQTHQPSAMGAMFKLASNKGWITPTDRFVNSKRPSSHARPIRVWNSII